MTDEELIADAEMALLHGVKFHPDAITRLLALARRGAEMEPRPMEEAPNDNSRLLVRFVPDNSPYGYGSYGNYTLGTPEEP